MNILTICEKVSRVIFVYNIAKELGCNIDKSRNLAKSVTVE